jgi:hypothetical protein
MRTRLSGACALIYTATCQDGTLFEPDVLSCPIFVTDDRAFGIICVCSDAQSLALRSCIRSHYGRTHSMAKASSTSRLISIFLAFVLS